MVCWLYVSRAGHYRRGGSTLRMLITLCSIKQNMPHLLFLQPGLKCVHACLLTFMPQYSSANALRRMSAMHKSRSAVAVYSMYNGAQGNPQQAHH